MTKINGVTQLFWILISLFLLSSCFASPTAIIPPESPSMFRGDTNHLGVYEATALRSLPTVKWKFKADSYITTSAALSSDLLYFGSDDGNLYALERETGVEKWRFVTQGPVHSSPAVVDGIVYFQSNDGFVYALDAQSGNEKWKTDTGRPRPNRFVDYDFLSSSPMISGGVLYIGGSDGNLYALDSKTGQQVWMVSSKGGIPVRGSAAVSDGVVYFPVENKLVALDATTGEQKWEFVSTESVRSSPAIYDGVVIFGDNGSIITAVDKLTGEKRWEYFIGYFWVVSTSTVFENRVYIGGDDSFLNALDFATGEEIWRFKTRGETIWSSPAFVNGTLYVGDWNYKKTVNEAGRTEWGYLYAVDALTGEKLWEFETGGNIVSSPVVDEDGTIYFGSLDGYLYALSDNK